MTFFKNLHKNLTLMDFPVLLIFVLLFFLAVNILNYGYFRTQSAYAFQVNPLPPDNLIINPWFRSSTNPNAAGYDYWTNVDSYWTLSQKLSNPTPDLLTTGRCSSTKPATPTYCGTAAKLAADDGNGEVGVDSYLYQIVSANPSNTKLKFFTHWVAHYVDPFRVTIYGGETLDGPWSFVWTPLNQQVLSLYKGIKGDQSSMWTHFTSMTPPVETIISQGFPYYKVEVMVNLPKPDGFKMTGVYFTAVPEFEPTVGPTEIPPTPDPNATEAPIPTLEPTLIPTETLPPPQLGTTLHVSNLETSYGRATGSTTWYATVVVSVQNENLQPVSGVEVTGNWSNGTPTSSSCTTNSDGQCGVVSGNLEKSLSSVSFSVINLSLSGYTYVSSENTDSDGDSTGITGTVTR